MKLAVIVFASLLVAGLATQLPRPGEEVEDDSLARRSVIAGLGIASLVVNGLASFFSSINGSNNVKDTVLYGRAIRIHVPKDSNCAEVTDRESGYKSSKCADSAETAASMATEELFDLLIRLKFIDSDSLHHKPVLATRPPVDCIDRVPSCDKRIKEHGHCDPSSHFFHWMHENCYRSCGGCQPIEVVKAALQIQANQAIKGNQAAAAGSNPTA